MKRVATVFLACIMLISMFAGCTSKKAPEQAAVTPTQAAAASTQADKQTDPKKAVEISAWVGPAWKGVFDATDPSANFGDFHKYAAKKYMDLNPNTKINVEVIGPEERTEKLTIAVQSNTMPEIFFDTPMALFDYAHAGLLVPLNDIVTDEDKADISQATWDDVTIADKIYMFPFNAETGHLAVNVSLFKALGKENVLPAGDGMIKWTPEEFKNVLKAVSGQKDFYPFGVYCGSTAGDTWTNILIRMFGGSFFNKEGTEIILNQPDGVNGLAFLKDLQKENLLAPGIQSMVIGDVLTMFLNKKLAVSVFNNLNYNNLLQGLKDGSIQEPFELRWAYFPSEKDPMCFAYTKGSVVFDVENKDNVAVAKDFVKFYSSDPELVGASTQLAPFRKSVADKVMKSDPTQALLSESLKYQVSYSQNVPGYLQLRTFFFPELQAVFTDQKTPQEALDSFVEKGNKTLKTNVEKSKLLK